jgi:hypothetical protein
MRSCLFRVAYTLAVVAALAFSPLAAAAANRRLAELNQRHLQRYHASRGAAPDPHNRHKAQIPARPHSQ